MGSKRLLTLTHRAQVKRFTQDLLKLLKSQASKQVIVREFSQAYHWWVDEKKTKMEANMLKLLFFPQILDNYLIFLCSILLENLQSCFGKSHSVYFHGLNLGVSQRTGKSLNMGSVSWWTSCQRFQTQLSACPHKRTKWWSVSPGEVHRLEFAAESGLSQVIWTWRHTEEALPSSSVVPDDFMECSVWRLLCSALLCSGS